MMANTSYQDYREFFAQSPSHIRLELPHNGTEANEGFQNRVTGTVRYFGVKFCYVGGFGIKVMKAEIVIVAGERPRYNSNLDLYLIILGGTVIVNGKKLPKAVGYHLVVRHLEQEVLVLKASGFSDWSVHNDLKNFKQLG
jgi:hypothetical protein